MADQSVAPVRSTERLKSLDALRGFALLGILVPNIVAFGWPSVAMKNPIHLGGGEANELGFAITSIVFLSKFRFLFAMLFGAGVIVYARKYDHGDQPARLSSGVWLWYRRCALLLGFGLIHAYGFWYGDILAWYAIAGLTLLWWVRRLSIRWQIVLAGACYVFGMLVMLALLGLQYWAFKEGHITEEQMAGINPKLEIEAMLGSWFDGFMVRLPIVLTLHLLAVPVYMPVLWGIMIFGMALCKAGVLGGSKSAGWYLTTGFIGLVVGMGFTLVWFNWSQANDDPGLVMVRAVFVEPAGILLALGYAMLVIAATKSNAFNFITTPLAAVGRMALTNYFLHTLLCTSFFYGYGWGLGYFAKIQYPGLWYVIGTVWVVNIVFSMVWLKFFRFGPVEWAWRCMTYGKLLPILHKPTTTAHPQP